MGKALSNNQWKKSGAGHPLCRLHSSSPWRGWLWIDDHFVVECSSQFKGSTFNMPFNTTLGTDFEMSNWKQMTQTEKGKPKTNRNWKLQTPWCFPPLTALLIQYFAGWAMSTSIRRINSATDRCNGSLWSYASVNIFIEWTHQLSFEHKINIFHMWQQVAAITKEINATPPSVDWKKKPKKLNLIFSFSMIDRKIL